MLRRIIVAPVFLVLAGVPAAELPKTAAPAAPQGSIDLPATETAHRYDAAIKPGDDTRTPRRPVVAVRSAAPVRPPTNALTEREKQAIARWDREEAPRAAARAAAAAPDRRQARDAGGRRVAAALIGARGAGETR